MTKRHHRRPPSQMTPWWRRRSIVIPPDTPEEWVRLVAWEMWMGAMLLVLLYFGTHMITTSPDRVITVTDLTKCYAEPPIPMPCDRVYHAGMLNVAFSAFSGFIMIAVATWFLWELWSAAEPKPITDDFLRLLNDSFGRDWRNPMTWPWARALWAFGFTALGAALTAAVAIGLWSLIIPEPRPPIMRIDTSQSFRSR